MQAVNQRLLEAKAKAENVTIPINLRVIIRVTLAMFFRNAMKRCTWQSNFRYSEPAFRADVI